MTRQLAAAWRLGAPLPALGRTPAVRATVRGPRRAWKRPVLWASLLLHAALLAALFLLPRPAPLPGGLGPPSISVVLAPGDMPANPTPTPQAAMGTPDAEVVQRAAPPDAITPLPPGPANEPRSEPAAPPVPPLAFAPQAALPLAAPPAVSPPSVSAPLLSSPPIPVTPVPDADLPLPPLPPSTVPPPLREALVQPPPVRLPPRPQVTARPPPRPRQTAPSGFPMPMFSSLGGAFPQSRTASRAPSREMAGPVRPGREASRLSGDIGGDNLGPGWERLLRDWVDEHKHYPEQAAENGDDGDVVVNLVIARDGRVQSVSLAQRSGSMWLDLALQALFRSQRVPPFPPGTDQGTAQITYTMHYILVR